MESSPFTAPTGRSRAGMTAARPVAIAIAVLALLALSGCTPGAPTPGSSPSTPPLTPGPPASSTATPEPTPTDAAPVPATITVSSTGLSVLDATATVLVDIPFTTAGDAAATELATALGATPVVSTRTGSNCSRAGNVYDFGGLWLEAAGTITMAPPAVFSVHVLGSSTTGGVAVTGPNGVQVGMAATDVVAAIPSAAPSIGDLVDNILNLQSLGGPGGPDETGLAGLLNGGTLVSMDSPVYIFGDC